MANRIVARRDVLRYRLRRHQLDRRPGTATGPADAALLDFGVQDTGHDGAAWALAVRGLPSADPRALAMAWTVRGAPHLYDRATIRSVATATAPLSEADAAKRIFDANKPLKAAGLPALEALGVVARHLRDLAAAPIVKGDLSGRLTELVDDPYLRSCGPCATTHVYEMPFRLAALQAGLELDVGTSPPVLRRIPKLRPPLFRHLAGDAEPRFDVIRNYLRFFGPGRVKDVAAFLDAPVKEVKAHWPADVVEVVVGDAAGGRAEPRFVLAGDVDALTAAGSDSLERTVRLVGPYDPYLQLRDRELLVADDARRKDLWRVLGRPGAVVADGEVVGTWRPRAAGRKLTVRVEPWGPLRRRDRGLVEEQAERLAEHRDATLVGIDLAGG